MELLKEYIVCYIIGKGIRLIPILLPKCLEKAVEILPNKTNRDASGVHESNQYVFAYIEQSNNTITGYNEIYAVCYEVGIPLITAISIRHRAATMFWKIEGHSGYSSDLLEPHGPLRRFQ